MPSNWKELARDCSEKVANASYDLAKVWFQPEAQEEAAAQEITTPASNVQPDTSNMLPMVNLK